MLKLDKNKLAGLKTFDDHLQERYGDENSPERKEFEAKAKAWYYAELLKDERKRQNVTQKALGQWKFSGDKHKSLQVDTERTFHQRYPLAML